MTKHFYAILLTSLFLSGCKSYASSPSVKVELRSSWPAPPFVLECIESISIEEPDAFFPLVDALTDFETLPNSPPYSPEALYRHALETSISAGFLSEPDVYAVAEMGMALHAAAPKIEAFYQYYVDRHSARTSSSQATNCGSWVDWYGQVICDAETLARLVNAEATGHSGFSVDNEYPRPKLLQFDHVHPSSSQISKPPPRTAILYASLTSDNFRELHSYLFAASRASPPYVEYVLRPIPPDGRNLSQRTYLSGYGVTLDLKKMDYLALDDRHRATNTQDRHADDDVDLSFASDPIQALLYQYPENNTLDSSTPLTEDELLDIGLQAAQLIYNAEEPLSTLKQLSQNFPKYATSLARRVTIDPDLLDEVEENQIKAQGGASVAWLNGMVIHERDMNPFGLLRLLRKERGIMRSLMSLGLSPEQAVELLTYPSIGAAQSQSDVLDGLVDASDRQEEGDVIVWWNDLEKDDRYSRWGASLRLLLRPLYPGQWPNVKANLFNIILAVDLSQSSSLHFISVTVSNIITRGFPFRWGVVPIAETEDGTRMARLFYFLIEHFGRAKAMEFLRYVSQAEVPMQYLKPTVDWALVRSGFRSLVTTSGPLGEGVTTNLDSILGGLDRQSGAQLAKVRDYAVRLGTTLASAPQGHAFVNGKYFDLDDEFLRNMQIEFGHQMQYLQEQLSLGKLSDNDLGRISTYFYDLPAAAKRRNRYIYPSSKAGSLRVVSLPELLDRTAFPRDSGSFLYPTDSEFLPFSTYIVADFNSEGGLFLMKHALNSANLGGVPSRFSFVHNPSGEESLVPSKPAHISSLLAHLTLKRKLHRMAPSRLLEILGLGNVATPGDSTQIVISSEGTLDDILGGSILEDAEYEAYLKSSRLMAHELRLAPGEQAVIVNGRVLGPMQPGEFTSEDFEILMEYESNKRTQPVVEALKEILESSEALDHYGFSETVSMAASIVSAIQVPDPSESGLFNAPQRTRRRSYQLLDGKYTAFMLGDKSASIYHFGILVDPLSEAAQRWSGLLEWLLDIPHVFVELRINPARYRELPLKRFYRYNLHPRPKFDENEIEMHAQTEFVGLPVEPIYTLAMDVPQSWLVRPREALHDLDNIQLGSMSAHDSLQGVRAVFDLDYLAIEGHARDTLTNAPPRGVQLQLTTSEDIPIADTQVVANLGYLQFRAKPGVFRLEIRPGRGRAIFGMESVGNEGWNSPTVEEGGDEITLTSFEGLTLYPRLARLPGMERADVLAEVAVARQGSNGLFGDIMSWVASLLPSKAHTDNDVAKPNDQADINIFTVASGLLYERFVSIMVVSVLRNTNSSVKFWFIENFLSPSFLEFIPHFAEAYNFKYELVTYKWPSWLRTQKEKQRIIWAYKILFLDVLFPMDLKKVIFVDADQIVRTDLKELIELDLHGAPYGYTPMGDDNVEMEGFRFWKTGYWKEFLRGLPYHISALYVVDLVRFRQLAAGDILRGHYQQLSADPDSLANLDQDLPNNLQREVPIFSLPEDWLWCETWCQLCNLPSRRAG
ncbi:hypothetical protein AcW1_009797 [Taiwanofungus camphoratus]|nr:hypothetical protein AcW1_009797 [Antrodia cinnamomea]